MSWEEAIFTEGYEQGKRAAEADAAVLRSSLDRIASFSLDTVSRDDARAALTTSEAGAALVAEQVKLREHLAAVQRENAALREWLRGELTLADVDINAAIAGQSNVSFVEAVVRTTGEEV